MDPQARSRGAVRRRRSDIDGVRRQRIGNAGQQARQGPADRCSPEDQCIAALRGGFRHEGRGTTQQIPVSRQGDASIRDAPFSVPFTCLALCDLEPTDEETMPAGSRHITFSFVPPA